MNKLKKYDLHVHTNYSECGAMTSEVLLKLARKQGLDGIAITDHNAIKGAKKAFALNKKYKDGFEVVMGEEVMTDHGELLIYYAKEEIPKGDLLEVLDKARQQDAVISIAHPFTLLRTRFTYPIPKLRKQIHAIECFNSKIILPSANKKAEKIADKLKLAKTGGSDAHYSFELGNGYTLFQGDLRKAIKNRKTVVGGINTYLSPGTLLSAIKKRIG